MKGFLALFVLLLFCVDFTKSASCVALAKKLTVSYGTSCDLTSSLTGLDEVSISGTVNVQGSPGSTPLSLEATNIYVYSTGRILADGYGYGPMNGPGKGSSGGSGGSHGGRGGMNSGTFLKSNEAVTYGGIEKPSAFGSGGGCSTGGKGGGVITLKAIDDVRIDGLVSANGNPDGSNCGGGSGGSIYVDTDYFKGSGMVTARGGTGNGTGGGGGGGRISIVHRVSATFSGNIFADGGESSTDVNQLTLQSTTASSARYTAASYGDMTKHSTNSWRAYHFNTDQWLQATLSSPKWITRVATRGHQSYNMWVKTYKIQYYNDTSTAWVTLSYPSDGFSGNTDNNGIVYKDLFAPIYTSKIRFYPQTWNTGISMSVKLYGYNNYDTVSVPPTTCSSTTSDKPMMIYGHRFYV